MTVDENDLNRALKTICEQERGDVDPPTPEDVLKYFEEKMTEEEQAAFLEKLTADKDSVNSLLDLHAYPDIDAPELPESEVDAAWRDFQRRQSGRDAAAKFQAPASNREKPSGWGWTRLITALAAGFLIAAALLSIWAISLHRELRAATEPRIGILPPPPASDSQLRGQTPGGQPANPNEPVMLPMPLDPDWGSFDAYFFEIQGDNRVLSKTEPIAAAGDETLWLTFYPHRLPESEKFEAVLFGVRLDTSRLLKRYDLKPYMSRD